MKTNVKLFFAIFACIYSQIAADREEPLIANRKYKPWSEEIKSASESKVIMEPITSSNEKAPRFSIGLGTLSPSYSQKFGADGKTRLDFNHENNGYSYSLSNMQHPTGSAATNTQTQTTAKDSDRLDNRGYNPGHYYQPGQPQFAIYQKQGPPNNTPTPFYSQVPVVYGNAPSGQYPLHPLASGVTYNNVPPFYQSTHYQNNDNNQNNDKHQSSNSDIKSSAQQQSSTSTQPNNVGQNGVGYGQQGYGYPPMHPLLEEYVRGYQMLQQAASLSPTAVSPFSGQQPFGQQSQINSNYGYNPYAAYNGGFGYNGAMSAAASNPILSLLGLTASPQQGFGALGGMSGAGGYTGFPFGK